MKIAPIKNSVYSSNAFAIKFLIKNFFMKNLFQSNCRPASAYLLELNFRVDFFLEIPGIIF